MIRLTNTGPVPKPVKEEKQKMTAKEFQKKYANPKKGKSIAGLKKEADDWFSRRVRLEECDSEYRARCVDCGVVVDVRRADCGHYHSRKYLPTRWERKNCAVQQKWHNNMMGDPVVNEGFKNELIKRHGKVEFEMLAIKKNNSMKLDKFLLTQIIDENREIAERLLQEKGLKKWW